MPVFSTLVRRPRRGSSSIARSARPVELLEDRRLMAATLVQAPPAVSGVASSSFSVDLSNYFDDPTINSRVRFTTELGNIDIELLDQAKPITVANFLKYVRQGRFDTTIIHRATEPTSGLEVIQGGGYAPPTFQHIATDAPITNEAPLDPVQSNLRGTIAMARTSEPNSATSEWFINSVNNTSLDPASQPPGYTVFGEVINNSMTVVDAIQALPTFAFQSPFGEIPLRNFTQQDFQNQVTPDGDNFVSVTAGTLPKLTYNVQSSDPSIVTPSVTDNKLTLAYGTVGTTNVTITATDANGSQIEQTFAVTVAATANLAVTLGGTSGNSSVTFTDAGGTTSTISVKGPGTATVTFDGNGLSQTAAKGKVTVAGTPAGVKSVAITGASAATAVTVTGKGGDGIIDVAGFTADSALKSVAAKSVNLTGALSVTGAVGKLDLGPATNGTITLGGTTTDKPGTITLGAATATGITSGAPLKSVTAASFAANDQGRATITAPALDSLTVKGNMAQSVNVTGAVKKVTVSGNAESNIQADSIGTVSIKGTLTNSSLAATQAFSATGKPIGKVTVSGAVTNSVIRAAGNITSITAGSIATTTVFAGVASSVDATTLPTQAANFETAATIGTLTVKGTSADFIIAASKLNKINLGSVTTGNNGAAFGVAADSIATLTGTIGSAGKGSLKKLETAADVTAQTTGFDLGDLDIIVV